jgi:tetratricopeptide (TPR) repeat protein
MAQNELQNAIQEFLTATKLTQDVNAQNHQFQASAFLDLGIAYTLSKDYAKALASFQQANQSGPARVDNAIANLEQSVTAAPAEVNYLKLSLLLRAKGLDQEASTVLQQAANENPSYIESRALLSYLNASE